MELQYGNTLFSSQKSHDSQLTPRSIFLDYFQDFLVVVYGRLSQGNKIFRYKNGGKYCVSCF